MEEPLHIDTLSLPFSAQFSPLFSFLGFSPLTPFLCPWFKVSGLRGLPLAFCPRWTRLPPALVSDATSYISLHPQQVFTGLTM